MYEKALLERALLPDAAQATVGDLLSREYCTVEAITPVTVLSDLLRKVRLAIVLDGTNVANVVTRIDVLSHVARAMPNA